MSLYLQDLIQEVRANGDFTSDPNITDANITFWLQQAYERFYYTSQEKENDEFLKTQEFSLSVENQRHYFEIPPDFSDIFRVSVLIGGQEYLCKKAEHKQTRSHVGSSFGYIGLSGNERIKFDYYPFAPTLPQRVAEGEVQPPPDNHLFPPYARQFLVDFAVKRSSIKQEQNIKEIELETFESWNNLLMRIRKRDLSYPKQPDFIREEARYYYEKIGRRIYIRSTDEAIDVNNAFLYF